MVPIQWSPEELSGLHETNLLLETEHRNHECPQAQPDAPPREVKDKDPIIPAPVGNKHFFQKVLSVSPF